MVNYEIISEEPSSYSEVLALVKKKKKDDLTYREEKILDFIKKIKPLSLTDFKKAVDEIIALEIPRLELNYIIKLIDINPKDGPQLRAIINTSGTVIVDENVTKILDILKKYG